MLKFLNSIFKINLTISALVESFPRFLVSKERLFFAYYIGRYFECFEGGNFSSLCWIKAKAFLFFFGAVKKCYFSRNKLRSNCRPVSIMMDLCSN